MDDRPLSDRHFVRQYAEAWISNSHDTQLIAYSRLIARTRIDLDISLACPASPASWTYDEDQIFFSIIRLQQSADDLNLQLVLECCFLEMTN